MFSSDGLRSVAMTAAGPLVTQSTCAAKLRQMCNATGHAKSHSHALFYSFSRPPPQVAQSLMQDLANFMLVRGPFAWLGSGWHGCDQVYDRPALLDSLDVGTPVGNCSETAPGSGVFVREYTKAKVAMNCSAWNGTIESKTGWSRLKSDETTPPVDGGCAAVMTATGLTAEVNASAENAYLGVFRDAATPLSQPSALLMATVGPNALRVSTDALQPSTTYTLRWRFRPLGVDPSINSGFGWGRWQKPFVCKTLAAGSVAAAPSRAAAAPPQAKALRLYRLSEFTVEDVDFLSNHSSGDAGGQAILMLGFYRRSRTGAARSNHSVACLGALEAACPGLRYRGRQCLECAARSLPLPACGDTPPPNTSTAGPHPEDEAHFFCGLGFPSFNWQSPFAEITVDYLPFTKHLAPSSRDAGFVPYTSCDAPNYGFGASAPSLPGGFLWVDS